MNFQIERIWNYQSWISASDIAFIILYTISNFVQVVIVNDYLSKLSRNRQKFYLVILYEIPNHKQASLSFHLIYSCKFNSMHSL